MINYLRGSVFLNTITEQLTSLYQAAYKLWPYGGTGKMQKDLGEEEAWMPK